MDLTGMNLTGATLSGDWGDSDFTDVNLTDANLSGMNLNGGMVMTRVTYANTICPNGSNSSDQTPQSCVGQGDGW